MKLALLILLTLTVEVLNICDPVLFHSLMNKIDKLEKELNELKQQNENNKNKHKKRYHINSEILENKEHIDFLYNRLENNLYLKHKDFHLRRIYNSKIDGRYLKNLYEKCDKEKMILLVYESDEGFKFGGFIQEFVTQDCYYCRTDHNYNNEDFIFSLDDMKVYNAIYNNNQDKKFHLRIYKNLLAFESVIWCNEDGDKSFLDDCKIDDVSSNEFWSGANYIIKHPPYVARNRIKTLEAFQVIIDKNELN